MTVWVICIDLLREAAARKWFIAVGIAVTTVLVTIGFALRMDVVDGALAASRLFGEPVGSEIRAVDVALRPLFAAAAYMVFYGGSLLGILLCAGFGPSLLSPGRIEHLLSLPIKRAELLAGTFLGVFAMASICAMYGTGGLTLILGYKTGFWTWNLIIAGLLAIASFGTFYAGMLLSAVAVRSASLGAFTGVSLLLLGIVAGNRTQIAGLFEPGVWRTVFEGVTAPLPRVSQIGAIAAEIARSQSIDGRLLAKLLVGQGVFAAALLALSVFLFERKDF
jgi:Cu-processing system permease protein